MKRIGAKICLAVLLAMVLAGCSKIPGKITADDIDYVFMDIRAPEDAAMRLVNPTGWESIAVMNTFTREHFELLSKNAPGIYSSQAEKQAVLAFHAYLQTNKRAVKAQVAAFRSAHGADAGEDADGLPVSVETLYFIYLLKDGTYKESAYEILLDPKAGEAGRLYAALANAKESLARSSLSAEADTAHVIGATIQVQDETRKLSVDEARQLFETVKRDLDKAEWETSWHDGQAPISVTFEYAPDAPGIRYDDYFHDKAEWKPFSLRALALGPPFQNAQAQALALWG